MNILAHDFKLITRDRFTLIAIIAFILCIITSLLIGHNQAKNNRSTLASYSSEAILTLSPDQKINPTLFSRQMIMPSPALLDLTIGRSDIESTHTSTSFKMREDRLFDKSLGVEGPFSLASEHFDLSFIVIWLAPLLLIALGLSIISSDRDSGILKMQAVMIVPLWKRSLSRALFRWLIVFLPVLIAALIGYFLSPLSSDKKIRLLFWIVSAGSYLLVWQSIILFLSSFKLKQESLGMALFTLWIIMIVVIPSFGSAVVQTIHKTPSRFTLITEARAIETELRKGAVNDSLNNFLNKNPEFLINTKIPKHTISAAFNKILIEDRLKLSLENFEKSFLEQQQASRFFEWFSPAILTNRLLEESAGSSETDFNNYKQSSLLFHRQLKDKLLETVLKGEKLTSQDIENIPKYYAPETFRYRVFNLVTSIVFLCSISILLVLFSLNRLSKPNKV